MTMTMPITITVISMMGMMIRSGYYARPIFAVARHLPYLKPVRF